MAHKFKLGNKIRDLVSGLEGITTGRIEYLNGCVQYNIHPEAKDGDSKNEKVYYYDEQQCELVDAGIADKVNPLQTPPEKPERERERPADPKTANRPGGAPSTVTSAR